MTPRLPPPERSDALLDAVRFSPEQRLILEMHALRAAVQSLHNEMIELKLLLAPLPALLDEFKRLTGEQSA